MSTCSTLLSFEVPLPPAAVAFAVSLNDLLDALGTGGLVDTTGYDPAVVAAAGDLLEQEPEHDTSGCLFAAAAEDPDVLAVWVDESAAVEVVAAILQATLARFDLAPVSFEWALTCNRPEAGAFGGGAAVVTKDEVDWLDTSIWVQDKLESLAVVPAALVAPLGGSVFVIAAEHHTLLGVRPEARLSRADADACAATLVNALRSNYGLPRDAVADDWGAKLAEVNEELDPAPGRVSVTAYPLGA